MWRRIPESCQRRLQHLSLHRTYIAVWWVLAALGIIVRVLAGFVVVHASASIAFASDGPSAIGDVRVGWFASEREAGDGTRSEADDVRLRLRLGVEGNLAPGIRWRTRLAGRFSSEQDGSRLWLRAWTPTRTGLELGDATPDELHLEYSPPGAVWSLRAGRMQTSFELPGVAAKTLDRNDSPSTEIGWTDGLHWRHQLGSSWQSHLILQRNVSRGTGNTVRSPLTFDDHDSRLSVFAGLQSTASWGPVDLRMLSVTWMPDTLAPMGIDSPERKDYLTVTARGSAEWPLGQTGMRARLGGELGWALNTPDWTVVGPDTSGKADGKAWLASASLMDFLAGHGIGIVYGQAGGGWLLSPDFRNNDRLFELRYRWSVTSQWSVEARFRRREEIEIPASAVQRRVDDDFFLRVTGRF